MGNVLEYTFKGVNYITLSKEATCKKNVNMLTQKLFNELSEATTLSATTS